MHWQGGESVFACAFDNPIPGYDTFNVNNLRLWKAKPSREFDYDMFNSFRAVLHAFLNVRRCMSSLVALTVLLPPARRVGGLAQV